MTSGGGGGQLGSTGGGVIKGAKLGMTVRKLQDAPLRLLNETDVETIYSDLCEKC